MKWTDEDIKFLQSNIKTLTKEDIAKKLNRSEAAIISKIRQLTLTTPEKIIRLSRLQKNYIDQNSDKLTPEEISEDLDMDLEQVKEIVDKTNEIIIKPKKQKTQMQRMMTSGTDGVTIMTPGASAHGDGVRSRGKQKDLSHIHKIHEE